MCVCALRTYLNVHVVAEEDVPQFQVSVYHSVVVEVLTAFYQLHHIITGLGLRYRLTTLMQLQQRLREGGGDREMEGFSNCYITGVNLYFLGFTSECLIGRGDGTDNVLSLSCHAKKKTVFSSLYKIINQKRGGLVFLKKVQEL